MKIKEEILLANRLNLDFKIQTNVERCAFVEKYIEQDIFKKYPLTNDELETIANYIFWGKDEKGKNVVQNKEIQITTRAGTWDPKEPESLDALIESPTFVESSLKPSNYVPTKIPKEKFSRAEARKNPDLAALLEPLWKEIDWIDLIINFYDLAHGKRKNPIRETLLAKFSQEQLNKAEEAAKHLNPYAYLKKRHYLVELRREQFTLRDFFVSPIQFHSTVDLPEPEEEFSLEEDLLVYPFGLNHDYAPFLPFSQLNPFNLDIHQQEKILRFYWSNKKQKNVLDFTNPEHIFFLIDNYKELQQESSFLTKTLDYYIDQTDLNEIYRDILTAKINKLRNQDITVEINKKYNKSYGINYISTIYRQKIITKIIETVQQHIEIIENICYPENFKICSKCQNTFLLNSYNFVKKTKSKDGFANRCKFCDRLERKARS